MRILLALLFVAQLSAAEPIALWSASNTGDTHRVKITLEKNSANRRVCFIVIQIQGGAEQRGPSCWSVDAEREARTTWREVKDLPSGKWSIRAAVIRNDESISMSNELIIHVFGPNYAGPSDEP